MKNLRNLVIADRLYQSAGGLEAQVGDTIRMYLDTDAEPEFPEFVEGTIQHPIARTGCGGSTTYTVEYDEDDLDGAASYLRPADVVDSLVLSAVSVLAEDLALKANIAAPSFTGSLTLVGGTGSNVNIAVADYFLVTAINNVVLAAPTVSLQAAEIELEGPVNFTGTSFEISEPSAFLAALGVNFEAEVATPDTAVKRGDQGQGVFGSTGDNQPAITGTSTGIASAAVYGSATTSTAIEGESVSGRGVRGQSASFAGGEFSSTSYTGVQATSVSGSGGTFSSSSGTYAAEFLNSSSGGLQSAVERVRGWFVWKFSGFFGRLKTADITANRDWTLPDITGTIAALPTYANDAAAAVGGLVVGDIYFTGTKFRARTV